jgi:hypothetical protein
MAIQLTVTAKGQVTLRQTVLGHLGVKPGGKSACRDGRIELVATSAGHDLRDIRGLLRRRRQRPVSLEEMRDAIGPGRR